VNFEMDADYKIDVLRLSSGIYFICLTFVHQTYTFKFIKI